MLGINKNLSQFILQYYSSTIDIPEEVLIEHIFDEIVEYEKWLKGMRKKQVHFLVQGEIPEDDRPKGDSSAFTLVEPK